MNGNLDSGGRFVAYGYRIIADKEGKRKAYPLNLFWLTARTHREWLGRDIYSSFLPYENQLYHSQVTGF